MNKRLAIFLLVLLTGVTVVAQEKSKKKSQRHNPRWLSFRWRC